MTEEESRKASATEAAVKLSFSKPQHPPDNAFVTEEGLERYSMLAEMLQAEEREEKSKSKVWLPEGKITLEPFINPAEKRQWMSPPSQSSNGTSQRDSDAGPSIGADGSNHAASKDSNESGRERQSLAVGSSSFAASHTSNKAASWHQNRAGKPPPGRLKAQQHLLQLPSTAERLSDSAKVPDSNSSPVLPEAQAGLSQETLPWRQPKQNTREAKTENQTRFPQNPSTSVSPQESHAMADTALPQHQLEASLGPQRDANIAPGNSVVDAFEQPEKVEQEDLLGEAPTAHPAQEPPTSGGNVMANSKARTQPIASWSKDLARGKFDASTLDPAMKKAEEKQKAKAASLKPKGNCDAFLLPPLKTRDSAQMGISTNPERKVQSPGRAESRGRGRKRKASTAAGRGGSETDLGGRSGSGRGKTRSVGRVGKLRRSMDRAARHTIVGSRCGTGSGPAVEEIPGNRHKGLQPELQVEGGSDLEALDEEEDGNDFADLLMAELEPDDAEESSQQQRQPPAQKEKPNDHEAHREFQEATTKRPTALFASASKPSQKSKEAGLDGANRLSEVTLPGSITAKSHTLVGKSAGKAPAGVETQQVLPREGSYAQQGDFKRVKFNTTQSFSPGCPPKSRNPQPPEVPMPALEQGGAEAWEDEKASRKRKGQKMYQEVDLLNPCAPVFDADLAAAIRGLQKHPGPLMQGPCLLSGLTKQQHAWHINNAGKALHGHELTNMRDLEASIAEEQRVYMLAAHRLGMFSYKKELESCRPEILSHLEAQNVVERERVKRLPRFYHLLSNLNIGQIRSKELHTLQHQKSIQAKAAKTAFEAVKWRHQFSLQPVNTEPRDIDASPEEDESVIKNTQTAALGEQAAALAIPLSSLMTIAGLAEEDKGPDWEIPITVSESPPIGSRPPKDTQSNAEDKSNSASRDSSQPLSTSAKTSERIDQWQIGRLSFLVTSSQLPLLSDPVQNDTADAASKQGPKGGVSATEEQPVIVQAKLEYHSQKAAQGELITDGELTRWWLASQLHQGVSIWVGRVHALLNRLVRSELLVAKDLARQASAKLIPQKLTAIIALLLEKVQQLKAGQYLMTHARGSPIVSFYHSSAAPSAKTITKPLRLDGSTSTDLGGYFDLHLPHETSGSIDSDLAEYVPLSWVQPDEMVPQIPYTFRPRPNIPNRIRQRKLNPSFVTMRKGSDWDDVPNQEPAEATAVHMYDEL